MNFDKKTILKFGGPAASLLAIISFLLPFVTLKTFVGSISASGFDAMEDASILFAFILTLAALAGGILVTGLIKAVNLGDKIKFVKLGAAGASALALLFFFIGMGDGFKYIGFGGILFMIATVAAIVLPILDYKSAE